MVTPRPPSKVTDQSARADAQPKTGQGRNPVEAETVSADPAGPPAVAARCDFLAPAQEPGEIGRLGPYRVLGLLGAGGMGMVFRAADLQLGRHVALKVILPERATRPQARQRFLREARAIAAIEHLHVVPIFHVGEDRGVPYLVMPLLKGESLAQALKRTPRLPAWELVRIGREIAEGLAAAHAEHLVHRDVKPGNIWLEGEGRRVRLLDFGLARPDETTAVPEEPLTAPGQCVGTPVYMSPEQARGEPVNAAGDLFSLGVVLYQMATGVIPFAGPTVLAVLTALATKHPDPPTRYVPDLPPALSALIVQLLEKDPAQRPRSAQSVADSLRQIEAALPPVTQSISEPTAALPKPPPVTMTADVPRPPRHRRVLSWCVAGLLALIGGGFLVRQQIGIPTPKAAVGGDGADIAATDVGKPKVRKEIPPPEPLPADLQRSVAEWTLKQDGGQAYVVGAAGPPVWLKRGDSLPKDFVAIRHLIVHLPNPEAMSTQAVAWLKAVPEKETAVEIWLQYADWNDDRLKRLVGRLKGVGNLRLLIHYATVTDKGLRELLKLRDLRSLGLAYLKVSDRAVRELDVFPKMGEMRFGGIPLTDQTVETFLRRGTYTFIELHGSLATRSCLPAISKNPRLKVLSLRGVPFRDEDLRLIAELKELETFDLWGPDITNDGVRIMEQSRSLYGLRFIECPKVDDAVFDTLGKFKQLSHLVLTDNAKITDAGLAKVKNLSKLFSLSLERIPGITADGVRKLRAALPNLTVAWDGDVKK